jgi:hypothetical protein
MALVHIGAMNVPNYTALSSDIIGNKISGASVVGDTIFLTDTASWKIILDDLTLGDYVLPIAIGNVNIGDVGIVQPLSLSVHVSPFNGVQDVAVPGTAEALVGTATFCVSLALVARGTNVGAVYIGNATVDKDSSKQTILSPGNSMSIDAPLGYKIGVHDWYVDADNANDGVDFVYLK